MKFFKKVISLLFAILGIAVPSYAQDAAQCDLCWADTVQLLSESVVTAYRQPEKIIPAQTLQGEKLQKLSALSVADAIRYFSGVQIKDYGGVGGLKTINVRSMGTQHVGVFYDGVQLGNAQNGQIDLGKYSLENMESVTLYNGQKSTSVQSAKDYASAGAVYLRARTPAFEDSRRANLRVKASAGSFGTFNPSLLWEQKISERVSSSFNAEYLHTTGRYRFSVTRPDGADTVMVRENGDVGALRIEEGIFGKIDSGQWRLRCYFYDSQRGYPGAYVRESGSFKNADRQWDRNFFAQGAFFKQWGRYKLSISGKYASDRLRYLSDPRLDVTTMYVDNTYLQQELYASAANEFELTRWWDFNLAADWQYNTLDADLPNFVYPSRHTLLGAASTSVRFKQFKAQASLLCTYVDDDAREVGAAALDRTALSPTLIAQYNPLVDVNLALRAFYKRTMRMPTLNDLYYTFVGNKYLEPEYSTQYNIGVTFADNWVSGFFRNLDLSVDAYYNEVENKIIATPASNQFQWTMINLGLVQIRGVDASAAASVALGHIGADIRATYTFQKAQDFTTPSSLWYGGQIPYIPWHSGSLVLGLQWRSWHLNYSFIYTGGRYDSVANIAENYLQPWRTSDLSLSRPFTLGGHKIGATLEVNNLFNQAYEVVRCYPMPGTNFRFILTFEI